MTIFSTPRQLDVMRKLLVSYVRLPLAHAGIPGILMENVFSHVHGGIVLNTYDFVDVIYPQDGLGWQIKSTKASTPVTWKRAKIPNALALIEESRESETGLQLLGNAIIKFCNDHARESLYKYELSEIGYSRLILHKTGRVTYFERVLCSIEAPDIFEPSDFVWQWSNPKSTIRKEQLPALHGICRSTGKKWWAWHGLGENQLHFSNESAWWPDEATANTFSFDLPTDEEKLSFDDLMNLLSRLKS